MGIYKEVDERNLLEKFLDSPVARIDTWMIFLCGIGAFCIMIGFLMPGWRVDMHGTTELEKKFDFTGFPMKQYGIMTIKGRFTKSWTTQVQAQCDIRDLGMITSFFSGPCSNSDECSMSFANHAIVRCQEYERIGKICYVVMGMTFIGVMMIISGVIAVGLSKRRATGGVAFGLFLAGALMPGLSAIAWAFQTDSSFKKMGASAWYPYPSLDRAFYIYMFGVVLILVADTILGILVLPAVWRYDAATEKLEKKKRKLERRVERQKKEVQRRQEIAQLKQQAGAACNFPPPPAFGNTPPWEPGFNGNPVPWEPGFNGNAPPREPGFGNALPPQQGMYPPPQQYDPPPQQYGQMGGYGQEQPMMTNIQPAPLGDFGIDGTQQGYPQPGGPTAASNYWPARQPTDDWNVQVEQPQQNPGFFQRLSGRFMQQSGWNGAPQPGRPPYSA